MSFFARSFIRVIFLNVARNLFGLAVHCLGFGLPKGWYSMTFKSYASDIFVCQLKVKPEVCLFDRCCALVVGFCQRFLVDSERFKGCGWLQGNRGCRWLNLVAAEPRLDSRAGAAALPRSNRGTVDEACRVATGTPGGTGRL